MKKTKKARSAKATKNLPARTLNAKNARNVKGGTSLSYSKVAVEYKPQRSD